MTDISDTILLQKMDSFFRNVPNGRVCIDIYGTPDIMAGVKIAVREIGEHDIDLPADAAEAGDRPFTMGDIFRENGHGVLVVRRDTWSNQKTRDTVHYLGRFYKPE